MKRVAIGSVVVLALLLMVPNVALVLASNHEKKLTWIMASLAVPAGLLLGYFAVLGRRPWLACVLMAPFVALVPVVTFYIACYRTAITGSVLGTVAATNPTEARDFLGHWLWALAALSLAAGAFAVMTGWLSAHARLHFVPSRQARITLGALALVTIATLAGLQIITEESLAGTDSPDTPGISQRSLRLVGNSYPFGIPIALDNWWQDRRHLQAAMAQKRAFRFHAYRAAQPGRRQIYVLVIGESSRPDHWQLFGYGRPTNPELSTVQNLVPVRDMVSPWPMSIGGVPAMLTRKPPGQALTRAFAEQSIVGLMRQAGFDTWWLSNQSPTGEWNSPITVYADEAQHVQWLDLQKYDSSLAEGLAQVVDRSRGDLFVVLHMIGSHGKYDTRYPPAFAYFRPTVGDGGAFDTSDRHVTNSYDNTIRYTDHVLASVIGILQRTDAITAMWYQSDHGETLPTPTCSATDHGHGFRYEFPVPAVFWYSPSYAQAFPLKVATLRRNAGKRATSADTFATLTDMAGVDFPGHVASRSLFSPAWQYRPRLVHPQWQDGNAVVNYDDAVLGNGCEPVRRRAHSARAPKRPPM